MSGYGVARSADLPRRIRPRAGLVPDGSLIVFDHRGTLWIADLGEGADVLSAPVSTTIALTGPFGGVSIRRPIGSAMTEFRCTQTRSSRTRVAAEPAWSPSGGRIVATGQPRGRPDNQGIYSLVYPSDSGEALAIDTLTQFPWPENEPDWQRTADLAVTIKADPANVVVEGASTLTVVTVNEGEAAASSVTLRVEVPVGLTVDASSLPVGCGLSPTASGVVVCAIDALPPQATVEMELPVLADSLGELCAAATVQGREYDPDLDDNTDDTCVSVSRRTADMSVELTASVAMVVPGDSSLITAVVTNAGPQDARASVLEFDVTPGLDVTYPEPECDSSGSCDLGDLAAGAVQSIEVAVTSGVPGTYSVTGEASTATTDPDPTNNTDDVSIEVTREADVTLTLSAEPTSIDLEESSTLAVVIGNNGPSTALDPAVDVTLPSGLEVDQDELPADCTLADPTTGPIVCTSSDLPPGGATSFEIPSEVPKPENRPCPGRPARRRRTRIRRTTSRRSQSRSFRWPTSLWRSRPTRPSRMSGLTTRATRAPTGTN